MQMEKGNACFFRFLQILRFLWILIMRETRKQNKRQSMQERKEGKRDLPVSHLKKEVLDLLSHLVGKSLVEVDSSGAQGRGRTRNRYRFLETVRQYAREALAETDEAGAIRQRHRDFYLALAEEVEPRLDGPPPWTRCPPRRRGPTPRMDRASSVGAGDSAPPCTVARTHPR